MLGDANEHGKRSREDPAEGAESDQVAGGQDPDDDALRRIIKRRKLMESKITELEAQLETSRANEGEADSKLAEVHSKLTEVYSKLKEAQSKLNEIQSKSARMKSELQAKKSEIREKDAEIQRKDAEIAKLNGELEETREVCKLVDQLTAQVASRRRAPEQTTSPVGNASTAAPSITATPAPARDRTIEVVSRATPASSSTSPITTPQSLINANQANPGPSPGPSDISTPAPAAKPPKPKTPAAFSVLNSVLEAHHHNTGMFPHKRKLYASGEPMRERIKTAWAKAAREKNLSDSERTDKFVEAVREMYPILWETSTAVPEDQNQAPGSTEQNQAPPQTENGVGSSSKDPMLKDGNDSAMDDGSESGLEK